MILAVHCRVASDRAVVIPASAGEAATIRALSADIPRAKLEADQPGAAVQTCDYRAISSQRSRQSRKCMLPKLVNEKLNQRQKDKKLCFIQCEHGEALHYVVRRAFQKRCLSPD